MGAITDKHRQERRERGPLRLDTRDARIEQLEQQVAALVHSMAKAD